MSCLSITTGDLLIKVRDRMSPSQDYKTIIAWELLKRCDMFEVHGRKLTLKKKSSEKRRMACALGLTPSSTIACQKCVWKIDYP